MPALFSFIHIEYMRLGKMKPEYDLEDELCVVTYNDSLDFEFCQKHKLIDPDIMKSATLFILDLQNVAFIDSAGVGALVGIYRSLHAHGKFLCLINLQHNLMKVLQISEIEHLFPIFPSLDEARSHFQY